MYNCNKVWYDDDMTTTSGSLTIQNPDPYRHEDYDHPESHTYTLGATR